jgi:hypothetical protein
MKQTEAKWNFILWNETIGFSLIIVLTWVTESLHIPYYVFGEPFIPNWKRAALRTVVVLAVWAWVHLVTKRMLKRLHHLEEFIRMCSWCRKVCCDGEWMTMEKYLNSQYAVQTTHGMCPDCLKDKVEELKRRADSPSKPE